MLKAGYLGPEGTFSHEAAERYYGKLQYQGVPFTDISDMLAAVNDGKIQEAVVPIENSLEGAVNATLDIMALEVDLKIKSELVIPVRQNLLVKKGKKINDIKYVLSHPQPIGQCRKFLNTVLAGVEIKSTYSTAAAAFEVSMKSGDSAAIASAAAAKAYGLDIIASDIQDDDKNYTRFIIVALNDSERTGYDKTSIVFSTEDKPGSLYRILDIFNLWDINMTRIESRPAKNQLGRYIFFVDLIGHRDDEEIKDALTMVKKKTSFFKFLGSYPAYRIDNR